MTRGGARKGAGRPKGSGAHKEPTGIVRLPISLIAEIKQYSALKGFKIPLYSSRVQAGYATAADDHVEEHVDLSSYLAPKPQAMMLVRASGESMIDAGIKDGDLLLVNRESEAKHGKIVVAAIDGELTVKFLISKQGKTSLMPANPAFREILLTPENHVVILGVVEKSIHSH